MTSLLLLHGLTFDHRQWDPLRSHLPAGCPVLAPDLPGHGSAPALPSYSTAGLCARLHDQVVAAGLTAPVVVGHSLGGVLATVYAARYPVSGVVNIDQILLPGPFGALVRDAVPTLNSPSWRTVWDGLLAGMHVSLLPPPMRSLVVSGSRPSAALLLGYWSELIDNTDDEIVKQRSSDLAAIATAKIPYDFITSSEPPKPYRSWMNSLLPDLRVTVIPNSGHFPHLADPEGVARLIADRSRS
jgi:pimeloyl-ACP methyl ester carboxylesterase